MLRMNRFRLLLLALVFTGAQTALELARAWEREPLSVFQERRARLAREIGDGVIILFGARESDLSTTTTPFRQDENFYYLSGWNEPGVMLLMVPKGVKSNSNSSGPPIEKEILFIPARDSRQEKWTGPKLAPEDADAPSRTGFSSLKSTALLPSELLEALKTLPKIYTELPAQGEEGELTMQYDTVRRLRQLAPLAEIADLKPRLSRMRAIKSPGEIELIRKATEASIEAQFAAMKAVRPGAWEYEIAALMKYEFERRGCEWPAYPPIVGSGFFSTVLHYDRNWNQMQAGDLVVMDVAGAYSGYASDITRTLPVSGHFTRRQRELYEIVLGAQRVAIAAAKPGMTLRRAGANSLHLIAYDYINAHGQDLHGKPLGQYFIHGLGHAVGLNVHDLFDYDQPLQPGTVITIEPGIYIPEEKIGIRIEDLVLVTKDGAEVLSQRLPTAAEAIERIMSQP